jgi:hypothetical protein
MEMILDIHVQINLQTIQVEVIIIHQMGMAQITVAILIMLPVVLIHMKQVLVHVVE